MKKLIKKLIEKVGYRLVTEPSFRDLVPVGSIKSLDFYYLLKEQFSETDKIIFFDIGANIGQTALKFNAYFAGAVIYSFEPVKATFEKLQKTVAHCTNIKIFNLAFGESQGKIEIYHRSNSEWNSLVPVLNETAKFGGATSEFINAETLDHFIQVNGIKKIHLLKSDTEGYDLNVLHGAQESLKHQVFDYLYLEVGMRNGDMQHTYLVEVITYLEQFNYRFSGLFEKVYMENYVLCYANALFSKY